MIYHEKFGQHLRLGNFLFKYAWSVGMKEKYGCETVYPNYYLWQYLEHPPIVSDIKQTELIRPRKHEWTKEEQEYIESFDYVDNDYTISLNFFMQSVYWWKEYQAEVKNKLKFKEDVLSNIKSKYSQLLEKPFILISIRLGDYLGHGVFYQIPFEWYLKVLNTFDLNEYNVLVTSDDIGHAKRIFGDSFFYAEPNVTWDMADRNYHSDANEHFILGTLSSHQIIGNSTFSWWQAFLAEGNTYHTGKFFSPSHSSQMDDSTYYHPDWIKIDI
jgi:hypothetical protein